MEPQPLPSLTPREQEVMRHAAAGQTSADIGHDLGISEHTVRKHLEHVYRKLGVRNRAAAVAFAFGGDIELHYDDAPPFAPTLRLSRREREVRLREEAETLRGQAERQRKQAKVKIDQANKLIDRANRLAQ